MAVKDESPVAIEAPESIALDGMEQSARAMRAALAEIGDMDRQCDALAEKSPIWDSATRQQILEMSTKKITLADDSYEAIERCIREIDSNLKSLEADARAKLFTLRGIAAVRRGAVQGATDQVETYPSEPVYCTCRRVQFGDMIACDEETCEIEWFHYECVGLKSAPKGKWYCPTCRQKRAPVKAAPAAGPSKTVDKQKRRHGAGAQAGPRQRHSRRSM